MAGSRHPTLARLHAWTGLVLALPLIVIALSGAVLLFRDPLLVPADWRREPPAAAADDAELARLMTLPALREAEAVTLARGERGFHLVTGRDGRLAWWRVGAEAPADPAAVPQALRLEPQLLELHEHLLLGGFGDLLVRFAGPLATALLVVGLWMWWPLRRGWRRRDLVVHGNGRPQLLRSHLALGALAGVLCLAHAASGALMANNPAIRAWLKPLGDPRAAEWPAGGPPRDFAPGDPAAALAALRRLHPAGEITVLTPPAGAGDQWSLRLRLPGEDHPNGRSSAVLELAAGRIGAVRDARLAGIPGAYDDLVFPLHVGTLFGGWQRWLWLVGGIALARLALLGALSWLRRGRAVTRR